MDVISRREYQILDTLWRNDGPVGSGTLWPAFADDEFGVSEPTMGRLLRRLDAQGYTRRVANRGRVLTDAGLARLEVLRSEQGRDSYQFELLEAVRAETVATLLDVLVARRGVEREIARLAPARITEEEIAEVERTLETMRQETLRRGVAEVRTDRHFHRQIARACRNRFLSAALELIRGDEALQKTLLAIRQSVGARVMIDHERIVDALRRRDPAEA